MAMAGTRRRPASPAERILLRAWLSCILSYWCGAPRDASAFVLPAAGLQRLHSCLAKGGPQSNDDTSRGNGLRTANRLACCSMLSSETAKDVTAVRRNRERVPSKHNSGFVVYTGPEHDPERELTKEQQARKDQEQLLGTRIQKSIRLQKLKKELVAREGGGDAVTDFTDEMWAEAAGETVDSLRQALEEGASAKQALVVLNLGMVNNIVTGYVRSVNYGEFTKTDLVQDATMGLICAVEKFDPTRGFRFATYGQWWVRKYLNEGVQNHNRMIRIPVSLAYRIAKVKRVRNQLHLELGRAPTNVELAAGAGCTVEQVESCLEQSSLRVRSLDRLTGFGHTRAGGSGSESRGEGSIVAVDMLAPASSLGGGKDAAASAQAAEFLQVSLREDLSNAFVRLLDATERECLALRYGLQDGVTKSVEETAEIMDFCDSDDVRIITLQAMSKLRKGCLPEERKKLMSYLSLYEPETLKADKANTDNGCDRRRQTASRSQSGSGIDAGEEGEGEEESERMVWDFSNHGREELQHELTRYLRKHRIEKARAAVSGAGAEAGAEAGVETGRAEAGGAGGAGGAGASSGGLRSNDVLAKGKSRRKSRSTSSSRSVSGRNRRITGRISRSGSRKFSAEIAQQREERRRKLEEGEREREEERERERLLRPIPVGNGAGSAVVGDLEPKPNSREADQLEHLSRLLWDGEEEPEDFALSYGKRERPSLQ